MEKNDYAKKHLVEHLQEAEDHMSDAEVLSLAQSTTNPEEMAVRIKALRDAGKITQKAYTNGMHLLKLPTEEDIQEASDYLKEVQAEEEGKEE